MNLRHLVTYPIYLTGLGTSLLGLGWLFAPEPWLLDQKANEALLQTTYAQLLAADINAHLGDYLTGLYRFFGWWIFAIGLLVLAYAFAARLETKRARNVLHFTLVLIVGGLYALQLKFIPISPFLWATYGFAAMILLSFGASLKMDRSDGGGCEGIRRDTSRGTQSA
ncbi:MAG: hypothetical protein HYZ49_03135 [Chloroflexi bacterium]|nr:hypothetical protein [Chloroflexota bacterium]